MNRRWRSLACKNQVIDLWSKSVDWFLYDKVLRYERIIKEMRHMSSRFKSNILYVNHLILQKKCQYRIIFSNFLVSDGHLEKEGLFHVVLLCLYVYVIVPCDNLFVFGGKNTHTKDDFLQWSKHIETYRSNMVLDGQFQYLK